MQLNDRWLPRSRGHWRSRMVTLSEDKLTNTAASHVKNNGRWSERYQAGALQIEHYRCAGRRGGNQSLEFVALRGQFAARGLTGPLYGDLSLT
jgi:hypothetical protein